MLALVIPTVIGDRLLTYLDVPTERMAFLLAKPTPGLEFWTVVDDLYLADELDYHYQGMHGMELADAVRPRVLSWRHVPTSR